MNYPELQTTSYMNGRWYETPAGWFPSITTILGHTEPPEKVASLQRWRDSIGHEEADRITNEQAHHGTNVHLLLERYLKGEQLDAPIDGEPVRKEDMGSFNSVKLLLRPISEVWGQEICLYSSDVEVAGRCDCVGVYNGKPTIIDFKTSRRAKGHDDISNYRVQLAFYAKAHDELLGTNIRQGVIIMATNGGAPGRFVIPDLTIHHPELRDRAAAYWDATINKASLLETT